MPDKKNKKLTLGMLIAAVYDTLPQRIATLRLISAFRDRAVIFKHRH